MSKLSITDIQKIATLARIELDDDERSMLVIQLSSILDFVEQLQAIDTDGTESTSQVTGLKDVLRADEVKPCALSRDELLANAPFVEDGYIKVKRVL